MGVDNGFGRGARLRTVEGGQPIEDGGFEGDALAGEGVVGGEVLFGDVRVSFRLEGLEQGCAVGIGAVVGGNEKNAGVGEAGGECGEGVGGPVLEDFVSEGLGRAAGEGKEIVGFGVGEEGLLGCFAFREFRASHGVSDVPGGDHDDGCGLWAG